MHISINLLHISSILLGVSKGLLDLVSSRLPAYMCIHIHTYMYVRLHLPEPVGFCNAAPPEPGWPVQVQCDSCSKWRQLPPSFQLDLVWTCQMHPCPSEQSCAKAQDSLAFCPITQLAGGLGFWGLGFRLPRMQLCRAT